MTLKKLIVTAILTCLNALPNMASRPLGFDVIPGSYNHLMTAIHRQDNGLIWVGTSTGLCRYDGYAITPAPTALTDSATILNDYILDIGED